MSIQDVTDLEIYNTSLGLLQKLYTLLKKIPKSEYDTVLQLKRCGKSIPANIAEGWAKKSYELEFKRFLKIALGSSDEIITHLRMITITLPYLEAESTDLLNKYIILSKRINRLHSQWNKKRINLVY